MPDALGTSSVRRDLAHGLTLVFVLAGVLMIASSFGVTRTRCGSVYVRYAASMRLALQCIQDHQSSHGPLEVVASDGRSWWRQLVDAGSIHPGVLGATPGGAAPVDRFGNAVVFIPPSTLRVVGPNGVDDGGGADDWTFSLTNGRSSEFTSTDPDWMMWFATEHRAAARRAMIYGPCAAATLAICIAIFWRASRAFGMFFGMLCAGLLLLQVRPDAVGVRFWPAWLHRVESIGAVFAIIGGIGAGHCVVFRVVAELMGAAREAAMRKRVGFCSHCGYDLVGLPGNICPECGMNVETEGAPARD